MAKVRDIFMRATSGAASAPANTKYALNVFFEFFFVFSVHEIARRSASGAHKNIAHVCLFFLKEYF
jgi:hypothetical protein